jgi:carbon storage regulator
MNLSRKESAILVLSRKKNEQIIVLTPEGRRMVFTVVEIRGDKVRLGIVAEKEVLVHRREVMDAIEADQAAQRAAKGA